MPANSKRAIEARQMDSVFDDYVQSPLTRMVLNEIRAPEKRDALAVEEARSTLDRSYAWLDRWMQNRQFAANEEFSLADCAAAPALFYAHWGHPIPPEHAALHRYRRMLLARPSIARVVEEARPWRPIFPLKTYAPE